MVEAADQTWVGVAASRDSKWSRIMKFVKKP
jgi:hypothetical protein